MIQFLSNEGSSEGPKQFDTTEDMSNSTGNKLGDIAVIYANKALHGTVDTHFHIITFPDTVVLPAAVTESKTVQFRAVNSSARVMMSNAILAADSFKFNFRGSGSTGMTSVAVTYSSTDGITYTRTDTLGNPIELSAEVYCYSASSWDDNIGYFMQIVTPTFDGLFSYQEYEDKEHKLGYYNGIQYNATSGKTTYNDKLYKEYPRKVIEDILKLHNFVRTFVLIYDITADKYTVILSEDNTFNGFTTDTIVNAIALTSTNTETSVYKYELSRDTNGEFTGYTETVVPLTEAYHSGTLGSGTPYYFYNAEDISGTSKYITNFSVSDLDKPASMEIQFTTSSGTRSATTISIFDFGMSLAYFPAPTQLTADAGEILGGKIFYGKDGIATGTLGVNMSPLLDDTNYSVYSTLKSFYDNLTPIVVEDGFTPNKKIEDIPVNKDGEPIWDTSEMTNMQFMFGNCTNLVSVPKLNTANVTTMRTMFSGCSLLENVALFDTSNVTTMELMFTNCKVLKSIPAFNTSKVTNMNSMFYSASELIDVPLLDTHNVTDMYAMFQSCKKLETLPALNTSNVTNMRQLCRFCSELKNVPVLNTSKVTLFDYVFTGCTKLTDESLNNILIMCKNSAAKTDKTLNEVGLSQAQAERCMTLSNYSAFTAAGWTTGY